MDRAIYARLAEQEEEHWWFHGRREVLASLLDRFVPKKPKPRILEVGCGTGGNLQLLRRFGSVDAAEYDTEARAVASVKGGMQVAFCALPDRLDAEDGRYDMVVLLDVLEHVEDDLGSLRTVKRKIAPGGRILVTVPALPWLWSAHDEKHHHFRRYTKASLAHAAHVAGFRIVASGYFSSLLFPLVLATRLAKKALGRDTADDEMPTPFVNRTLRGIFGLERLLIGQVPMPIGSSLYLVAES
jgi:SAM-dependent methyltransferase